MKRFRNLRSLQSVIIPVVMHILIIRLSYGYSSAKSLNVHYLRDSAMLACDPVQMQNDLQQRDLVFNFYAWSES